MLPSRGHPRKAEAHLPALQPEKQPRRHLRVAGDPVWIPASAGMTIGETDRSLPPPIGGKAPNFSSLSISALPSQAAIFV